MIASSFINVIRFIFVTLFVTGLINTHVVAKMTAPHRSHAIAMHDDIKYPEGFTHFEYTNPNASKGGILKLGAFGTFDSLNPFIDKGSSATGLNLIFDSLTVSSNDEAFTQYGLLAHHIEWPSDRSSVTYYLRPEATFSDGKAVTAHDVVFSFNLLKDKGAIYYSSTYANVKSVVAVDDHTVTYTFIDDSNKELALIVGQLPIFPKHIWQTKSFDSDTHTLPIGSGPYVISKHEYGRSIQYKRNKNYWAKDLAVNKGKYNFDIINYDYYKDSVALLEAFKSGSFDFRYENSSKQWATGYNNKAVENQWIKKENIAHSNPTGMQAFIMNLRLPLFQDIRVRKALTYAFDFEWTNKNLFYSAYSRSLSYFSNSELASFGLPNQQELKLLRPITQDLPKEVFTQPFTLPVSDADGYNRRNLLKAKALLDEAGWAVHNNILRHKITKEAFKFEIMLVSPAFIRIVNPYVKALKKLGISARVKIVDYAQFTQRTRRFNFHMIVDTMGQSLSPGNEQVSLWHSSMADKSGSYNLAGIKNAAVDELVMQIVNAPNRAQLITATQALDRVLLHQYYTLPQWHNRTHRIAYWNKFSRPDIAPKYDRGYSSGLMTWWLDTEKQKQLSKNLSGSK
jgi:microcin C transport system substrate-binding protein